MIRLDSIYFQLSLPRGRILELCGAVVNHGACNPADYFGATRLRTSTGTTGRLTRER
jgi:hypothetical protein